MGKVAFLFPGQGAQYAGMGAALCDAERALYDAAEKIRPGITKLCFEGPADALKDTRNTQPCLYLVEYAAADALMRAGVRPDALAGFSLGEVTALAVGGAFDFAHGFEAVCERGAFMAECAEKADTGMIAVLKLTASQVEGICALFEGVYPVNYNCPGQITVAGASDALEEAKKAFAQAGARVVPLAVSGAFHSPYMDDAAIKFGRWLRDREVELPRTEVWSNAAAAPYSGDIRLLLARQINSPVRWDRILLGMREEGVDTFVEVGPGQTLSKFVEKTLPDARIYHAETPDEIAAAAAELAQGSGALAGSYAEAAV